MSTALAASPAVEEGIYVITFAVSFERMPLVVPFVHELEHISAFRSHAIEGGRAVFRLHVGYFASPDAARAALRVVQRHFTDAHVAVAPHRGLGSLDDTGITRFSVPRHGATHDPAPAARVGLPAAVGGVAAAPAEAAATSGAAVLQRYSIQLDALSQAVGPAAPGLEALSAHTLYRIHVLLDGAPHEALRLGFFASLDAAQQVLARVRAWYPLANVLPISGREYDRVRNLAVRRVHGAMVMPAPGGTVGPRARASAPARLGRAAAGAAGAADSFRSSDDDVCCEFGAHELPTADAATPYHPRP